MPGTLRVRFITCPHFPGQAERLRVLPEPLPVAGEAFDARQFIRLSLLNFFNSNALACGDKIIFTSCYHVFGLHSHA